MKIAYEKITNGNKLREKYGNDYFAIKTASEINLDSKKIQNNKNAYIIDSFKHDAEIHLLRFIFGKYLFVIGVFDYVNNRLSYLQTKHVSKNAK